MNTKHAALILSGLLLATPLAAEEEDKGAGEETTNMVIGGVVPGHLVGTLGIDLTETDGPKTVHFSEMRKKVWIDPSYPGKARRRGIEGECFIELIVDTSGRVSADTVDSCDAIFHKSLLRTANKWRFYPLKVDDEAIEVQLRYPVNYKLR